MNLNLTQNQERVYSYLLFLLWPLLSILVAIRDYKKPWAKNIVLLFVVFYAYNFVITNEGMDANSYRDNFIQQTITGGSFTDFINSIYTPGSNNLDFLVPALNFLVAKFTDNYRILFAIFGLIFGYFFSRNIWLLLNEYKSKIKFEAIFIISMLTLIIPIWNINGFRFWSASHIFIFGLLKFFLERKKIGLVIAAMTVFVHFSFLVPLAILFLYMFMGNLLYPYFYFFVASLFISELDLDFLHDSLSFLPELFQDKRDAYINASYQQDKLESLKNASWYFVLKGKALRWSAQILTIGIFWQGLKYLRKDKKLYSLFCFTLLFYGISNIMNHIPSLGRFTFIAIYFILSITFLLIQYTKPKSKSAMLIWFVSPLIIFFAIVTIRIGFDTTGLTSIIGNPLFALFIENDVALIELIK